jgi:hypothetical protein
MRRKPIDEQLAQVLEIMLNDEPENNEVPSIFNPFKFLNTYAVAVSSTCFVSRNPLSVIL